MGSFVLKIRANLIVLINSTAGLLTLQSIPGGEKKRTEMVSLVTLVMTGVLSMAAGAGMTAFS